MNRVNTWMIQLEPPDVYSNIGLKWSPSFVFRRALSSRKNLLQSRTRSDRRWTASWSSPRSWHASSRSSARPPSSACRTIRPAVRTDSCGEKLVRLVWVHNCKVRRLSNWKFQWKCPKWFNKKLFRFPSFDHLNHLQSVGQQHFVRLIATVAADELGIDFRLTLRHTAVRGLLLLHRRHASRPLIFRHSQDLLVLLRAHMLVQSRLLVGRDVLAADRADQLVVLQHDTVVREMRHPLLVQGDLRRSDNGISSRSSHRSVSEFEGSLRV